METAAARATRFWCLSFCVAVSGVLLGWVVPRCIPYYSPLIGLPLVSSTADMSWQLSLMVLKAPLLWGAVGLASAWALSRMGRWTYFLSVLWFEALWIFVTLSVAVPLVLFPGGLDFD